MKKQTLKSGLLFLLSMLIVLSTIMPFTVLSAEGTSIDLYCNEEDGFCSADVILSNQDKAKETVLYIAFYDGNDTVLKTAVNPNPSETVTYNAAIPEGAEFAKAMLWEKGTNAPLCKDVTEDITMPVFTSGLKTGLLYGMDSINMNSLTVPCAKIRLLEAPGPDYVHPDSFADYMVETFTFAENPFINDKFVTKDKVGNYYKPYMQAVLFSTNDAGEINNLFIGQEAIDSTGNKSVLTLTSKQIKGGTFNYSYGEATYYQNSMDEDINKTEIKLATDNTWTSAYDGVNVYINKNAYSLQSSSLSTFAANWTSGTYPQLTLVDSNHDLKYDIIFATSYESDIVEDISSRSYKLVLTNGTLRLDPSSADYTCSITDESGVAMDFSEIQVGDVVTVFESSDNESVHKDVIITRSKFDGMISEIISSANNSIKVKINDIIYEVDSQMSEYMNLSAGSIGTFSLDVFGKIVHFEPPKENYSYGYLFESFIDETQVLPELKTTIYTTDGEFETYGYAENIYFNSTTEQVSQSYLQSSIPAAICEQTLVVYTTDANDKITKIFTGSNIKIIDDFSIKLNELTEYNFEKEKLYTGYITENTILATCYNAGTNDSLNQENYRLISKDYFKENYSYKVSFITDYDSNIIMAMILKASEISSQPVDPYSPPVYITSVGTAYGADNTIVKIVNGYFEGESISILVPQDAYIYSRKYLDRSEDIPEYKNAYDSINSDSLKKGAMIQFEGTESSLFQYDYTANSVKVLVTSEDVAKMSVTNQSYIQDVADDVEGFLYSGSVYEIISRKQIVFDDGNEILFSGSDCAYVKMKGQTIKNIYGDFYFTDVETTLDPFGDNETNDDILIIYKFNGYSIGAIIVDSAGDNDFY